MKAGAIVSLVLGGLVGILLLVAGSLYLNDYGIEADVVQRDCKTGGPFSADSESSKVTVQTRILGYRHTVEQMSDPVCRGIPDGAFVIYHLRTGRTVMYTAQGGDCLYDSASATQAACVA